MGCYIIYAGTHCLHVCNNLRKEHHALTHQSVMVCLFFCTQNDFTCRISISAVQTKRYTPCLSQTLQGNSLLELVSSYIHRRSNSLSSHIRRLCRCNVNLHMLAKESLRKQYQTSPTYSQNRKDRTLISQNPLVAPGMHLSLCICGVQPVVTPALA